MLPPAPVRRRDREGADPSGDGRGGGGGGSGEGDLALPSPELTRARRPLELIYATVWEIYDGAPPMPGESPQAVGLRPLNLEGEGKAGDAGAEGAEDEEGGGPWGLSSHDAVLRIMDAVREVSGIISETISASERAAEAPPLAWPTSLFSLLFTLRYSTTAESGFWAARWRGPGEGRARFGTR